VYGLGFNVVETKESDNESSQFLSGEKIVLTGTMES